MTGSSSAQSVGLVAAPYDPAAQLVAEMLDASNMAWRRIPDGATLPADVSSLFFTTQEAAIAYLPDLATRGLPAAILLRRCRTGQDLTDWQTGLDLVAAMPANGLHPTSTFLALTTEAAVDLEARTGLQVSRIQQLRAYPPPRFPAVIDTEAGEIRIAGSEKRRTLPVRDFNWARVRRQLEFFAEPSAPTDYADLARYANGSAAPTAEEVEGALPPHCLFMVSNGVGLGHVTRLLSVARAMRKRGAEKIEFWSYSRATALIEKAGFPAILRQTAEHIGAESRDWQNWEAAELEAYLRHTRPQAVVFDGSTLNPGLLQALNMPGLHRIGLIWVRRGLWQPDLTAAPIELSYRCDLIVEPGDLAAEKDMGATARFDAQHGGLTRKIRCQPVVSLDRADLIPRRRARSALGLSGRKPTCLVNLGGSALDAHAVLLQLLPEAAAATGVRLLLLRSPFVPPDPQLERRFQIRSLYPVAPYLAAFDGIVAAAGYNSFHESVLLTDVPILFAPTNRERLDDQGARARFGRQAGMSFIYDAAMPEVSRSDLGEFFEQVRHKRLLPRAPETAKGAEEIADEILAAA